MTCRSYCVKRTESFFPTFFFFLFPFLFFRKNIFVVVAYGLLSDCRKFLFSKNNIRVVGLLYRIFSPPSLSLEGNVRGKKIGEGKICISRRKRSSITSPMRIVSLFLVYFPYFSNGRKYKYIYKDRLCERCPLYA